MVDWAPVLEKYTPLAPDGPSTSYSYNVAPIIRRNARGGGGLNTSAGGSDLSRRNALGTQRQIGGSRNERTYEETPSFLAARAAAEAAAAFDENMPMPGEGSKSPVRSTRRAFHDVAEAPSTFDAFGGLPSWLEDNDDVVFSNKRPVDEYPEQVSNSEYQSSDRQFVRIGTSLDVPLDAFSPELAEVSTMRGAVGQMRDELEQVGAKREAHLAEVRAFLELSGRKRLGTNDESSLSPATKLSTVGRVKIAKTENTTTEYLVASDELQRTARPLFGDAMASALGLPGVSKTSPVHAKEKVVQTKRVQSDTPVTVDKENVSADRFVAVEKRQDRRLKQQWRLYEQEKLDTKKREAEQAVILRLAEREAQLELDAMRAENVREKMRVEAEKAREEIRAEEQALLDLKRAAAAAELEEATRKHEQKLHAQAWEHQANLDEQAREAAVALAAEQEIQNAQAVLEAEEQFERQMIKEKTQREERIVKFAAQAEEARKLDSKALLEDLKRQAEWAVAGDSVQRRVMNTVLSEEDFEAVRVLEPALAVRKKKSEKREDEEESENGMSSDDVEEGDGAKSKPVAPTSAVDRVPLLSRSSAFHGSGFQPVVSKTRPDYLSSREVNDGIDEYEHLVSSRVTRKSPTFSENMGRQSQSYIDSNTGAVITRTASGSGKVEQAQHVAEAFAERAMEATLERSADANVDVMTKTSTSKSGTVSLLRLQLRAVSTLLEAQRRKHRERLEMLHDRYLEVDLQREAQDRLLKFASVEDDIRAARGLRRKHRKWRPPGKGVFLNSGTNSNSHNANASYASNVDDNHQDDDLSVKHSDDPFKGSHFSRSVLLALGEKHLMKTALGVFAAGAAYARARRAYCHKVWRRNAAGPARIALQALKNAVKTSKENEKKADAHYTRAMSTTQITTKESELFFEDANLRVNFVGARCLHRGWRAWRVNVRERKTRRSAIALSDASHKRSAMRGVFGQWWVAVLETERKTHFESLALSFRRRRGLVSVFHCWSSMAQKTVTARLKLLAATPGRGKSQSAAKASLEARFARTSAFDGPKGVFSKTRPSYSGASSTPGKSPVKSTTPGKTATGAGIIAAVKRFTALEQCVKYFENAPRRVAAIAAKLGIEKILGQNRRRFVVSEADCRWIGLVSTHMRDARAAMKLELDREASVSQKTESRAQRARRISLDAEANTDGGDTDQTTEPLKGTEISSSTKSTASDVDFDLPEDDTPTVRLTASARILAAQAFESDRTRTRARAVVVASARVAVAARDAARFLVERASDVERRAAADAASRASDRLAKAKALADADETASPSTGIATFGLEDASGGVTRARAEAARCESVARANALASSSKEATRRALADADAAKARAIAAAAVATAASKASTTAEKVAEVLSMRDASASEVSAVAEEAQRRETTLREAAERQRALAREARTDMNASAETVSVTATAAAERTEFAADEAKARAVQAQDESNAAETAAETVRAASSSVASPLLDALENARDALVLAGRWREDASSVVNAAEKRVSELSADEAAADAVLSFWTRRFADAARVEALASQEASSAAREAASSDPRAAAARRDAVSKRADADRTVAEARAKRVVADDAYSNADAVAAAAEAQLAEAREDTRVVAEITGEDVSDEKPTENTPEHENYYYSSSETTDASAETTSENDNTTNEASARAVRDRVTAAAFATAADANTEANLAERRASAATATAAAAESRAAAGFSKTAREAHAAHREAYELACDAEHALERARVHAGKVSEHAERARHELKIAMEESRWAVQVDTKEATPVSSKVAEVCGKLADLIATAVEASERKAECDVMLTRRTAAAFTSKQAVKTSISRLSVAEAASAAAEEREAFCMSTARMAHREYVPGKAVPKRKPKNNPTEKPSLSRATAFDGPKGAASITRPDYVGVGVEGEIESTPRDPLSDDDDESGDDASTNAAEALVVAAEVSAVAASREARDAHLAVVRAKSALEKALREASRDAAREVAARTRGAAATKAAAETRLTADEATTEAVAAAAAAKRALASMTRARAEREEVRVKQAAEKASLDAQTRKAALEKAERDAEQAVAASKKRAARAAAAKQRSRDAAEDAAERVEAARLAAADEARAVAKHEEETLREALALEAAKKREEETAAREQAAAAFAAECAARASKTEALKVEAIRVKNEAAAKTHAVEITVARDSTRRAEERREVKRSVMASAAMDTAFDASVETIAAVKLEKAYRLERERASREFQNEQARAAVEAAEAAAQASRDAAEQYEAEQKAHLEAEQALVAATARNKRFLAVIEVDEWEKQSAVAMERASALAAERVKLAQDEMHAALLVAKEKREAALASQRAAAEAHSRRLAAEKKAEAELANAEAAAIEAVAMDSERAEDERAAARDAAKTARQRADNAASDAKKLRRKLEFGDESDDDVSEDKERSILYSEETLSARLERANERAAVAAEAAERAFETVARMGDDAPGSRLDEGLSSAERADAAVKRAYRAEALAHEAAEKAEAAFVQVAKLEAEREHLLGEAREAEARAAAVASSRAAAENAAAEVLAMEQTFLSTRDADSRRKERVLEHVKAQHAAEVREAETWLAQARVAETVERDEFEKALAEAAEAESVLAELRDVSRTADKRANDETSHVAEARAATERAEELEREAVRLEREAERALVEHAATAVKRAKAESDKRTGSQSSGQSRETVTPSLAANQSTVTPKKPIPEAIQATAESKRAKEAQGVAERDAERAAAAAADAVSRARRLAAAMEDANKRASALTAEANARAAKASANAANARAEAAAANVRARAADTKAVEAKAKADTEAKARLKRSADELAAEKNKAVRAGAAARVAKSKADTARAAAEAEKSRAARCAEAAERARKDAAREAARAKKQKDVLAEKARLAEAMAAIKESEIRRRVEQGKVEAATKAAAEAASKAAEEATQKALEEAVQDKVREASAKAKADADAAAARAETRAAVAKAEADALATADAREALAVALAEASARRDAADAATRERDAALAEANTAAATRERRAVEAAHDAARAERARLKEERDDAEARAAAAKARAEAETARALEAERAVLEAQESNARDVEAARIEAEANAAALREAEATKRAEAMDAAARDAESAWLAEGESSRVAERNATAAVEALVAAVAEAEAAAAKTHEDAALAFARRDNATRAADAEERRREALTRETEEKLQALERRAQAAEDTAEEEEARADNAARARLAAEETAQAAERRAVAVAAGIAGAFGFVVFGDTGERHPAVGPDTERGNAETNVNRLDTAFDAVAGFTKASDSDNKFAQGVSVPKPGVTKKTGRAGSFVRLGKALRLTRLRPVGSGRINVADDRVTNVAFESKEVGSKRKTALTEAAVATLSNLNNTSSTDFTFPKTKTPSGESLFSLDLFLESPGVARRGLFAARRADARRAAANANRSAVQEANARTEKLRNEKAKRKRRKVDDVNHSGESPGLESTSLAAPRTPFAGTRGASPTTTPHTDSGDSLFSIDLTEFPTDDSNAEEFVLSSKSPLVQRSDRTDLLGMTDTMRARVVAKKALREMQRVVREEKRERGTAREVPRFPRSMIPTEAAASTEIPTEGNEGNAFVTKTPDLFNKGTVKTYQRQNAFNARGGPNIAGTSEEATTETTSRKQNRSAAYPIWLAFKFRKWRQFSRNAKLLKRVFHSALLRVEANRMEETSVLVQFTRTALRQWRAYAVHTRSARRERRNMWRAATFHKTTVTLKHFVAWRVAFDEAMETRRVVKLKNYAFLSWRALVRHRSEVRRRLVRYEEKKTTVSAHSVGVHQTCLVKAWRAWRGRAATGRAATEMRRRALCKFIWPLFSSWRAVVIAALRDEVTAELRIAAHARNAIWRAWRAWVLGVGSIRFATGARAPTPAIPQGGVSGTPSVVGGRAVVHAGTAARRFVLGRAVFAAWRLGSLSDAIDDDGVDATRPSRPRGVNDSVSLQLDAETVLADAETQLRRNVRRASVPLPHARTVAAVVAEEDDASEVSEVPPVAGVDPEVYLAARREWLRRSRGGGR